MVNIQDQNDNLILDDALNLARLTDSFMMNGNSSISTSRIDEDTVQAHNIEERLRYLERSLASLQNENCSQADDIKVLYNKNLYLEKQLYKLEQYNRRENIEISGISEDVPQRELENLVLGIFHRIGIIGVQSYDIAACHRLKRRAPNERMRRVIVRFTNRKWANLSLARRRILNNFDDLRYVRIYNNLCPHYREIHEDCQLLKDTGKINNYWTYNGIVHIKDSNIENERPRKIFHRNDLNDL